MDAVERCGVNHLAQFPTFLSKHLQQSRQDARLLSILRGLDEIIYGGLPLAREDEEWACQKGIKLLVRSAAIVKFVALLTPCRTFSEARNVASY